MKLHKLISGLAQATTDNPLGEESLLPYWNFFWTAEEQENIPARTKIRIFLLHVYFHYFNDKIENSAIFMTTNWPDWMLQTARRHTRPTIGIYNVSDSKTVTEIVTNQQLDNIGWFTDAEHWDGTRMEGARTSRTLLRKWPRAAAHLILMPCPALADFGGQIQVSSEGTETKDLLPKLMLVAPYSIMIGFVE